MAFSSICTLNSNLVRTNPNSVKPFLMLAGGGSTTTNALSSSYNGLTWNTFGTAPFYFPFPINQINTFATNGTILVAGGLVSNAINTLCYSNDGGITWTGLGISIFSTACYGMVYNPNSGINGRFVAVGNGTNSIAYSDNGINWTGLGASLFASGRCIDYIGGYYIAAASSGPTNFLATSSDGINWTGIGKPRSTTGITSIASCRPNPSSNVKWVAVGSGSATIPTVMFSTDPSGSLGSWTIAYMDGVQVYNTIISNCSAITYNGTNWILGGITTNGTNLAKSSDGQNWTQIPTILTGSQVYAITNNGSSTFVAVGQGNTIGTNTNIVVSTDNGSTWSQRGLIPGSNGAGGGPMYSVIWVNNSFIIGSNFIGGIRAYDQYMVISLSSPFTTIVGLSKTQMHTITGIATNGTNIVVSANGTNSISTSTDNGKTWISQNITTLSISNVYWASAFNKFIFATGTSLYTSSNGLSWTTTTVSTFTGNVRGIAASDPSGVILNSGANQIVSTVVIGNTTNGNLYVSTDLLSWNFTATGLTKFFSICWSPILNIFIAVGQSSTTSMCVMYSTNNGYSWNLWSPPTSPTVILANSVSWSSTLSRFIVCGEGGANGIAWSDNGTTWVKATFSSGSMTTAFSSVWNSSINKWFIMATSSSSTTGVLFSSSDGKTWALVTQSTVKLTGLNCAIQVLPGF